MHVLFATFSADLYTDLFWVFKFLKKMTYLHCLLECFLPLLHLLKLKILCIS